MQLHSTGTVIWAHLAFEIRDTTTAQNMVMSGMAISATTPLVCPKRACMDRPPLQHTRPNPPPRAAIRTSC